MRPAFYFFAFFTVTHAIAVASPKAPLTEFIWSGGVTSQSASVVVKASDETNTTDDLLLEFSPKENFSGVTKTVAPLATVPDAKIVRYALDGLSSNTRYCYRVRTKKMVDERVGTFTTPAEGAFSFRFAFSACAGNERGDYGGGSNPRSLREHLKYESALFS